MTGRVVIRSLSIGRTGRGRPALPPWHLAVYAGSLGTETLQVFATLCGVNYYRDPLAKRPRVTFTANLEAVAATCPDCLDMKES